MPSDHNDTTHPGDTPDPVQREQLPSEAIGEKGMQSMRGPSESEQSETAAAVESLRQVEGIRPDRWLNMEEPERVQALQEVETRMAGLQGRPSAEAISHQMDQQYAGYYDDGKIHMNQNLVRSDNVADNVDTVIHEGRHAYQRHAIENPEAHDNPAEVNAWAENMEPGNYVDPKLDPERYRKQPVEADAWQYAGEIRQALYERE